MVDSIKAEPPKAESQPSVKQPDSAALRESFRNLSSGLSVAEALKDAPAVVHVKSAHTPGQLGKVVTGLRDAVKSSSETLMNLEAAAREIQDSDAAGIVGEFARDLAELKSDIVTLLQTLRERAGAAEVLSENMEAAEVRLEDVERAKEQAVSIQSTLPAQGEKALSAHSELNPARVSTLLAD